MSFSKFFWGISRGLLAATALILIAGMAFAILDDGADIFPAKSPDYDWSGGYVDARGTVFSSGVYFQCTDEDNDFRIHCDTDHPDKVRLSGQKGRVDQTKKDNNAHVWANVSTVDGEHGRTTVEFDTAGSDIDEQLRFDLINVNGVWLVDFVQRLFNPDSA